MKIKGGLGWMTNELACLVMGTIFLVSFQYFILELHMSLTFMLHTLNLSNL